MIEYKSSFFTFSIFGKFAPRSMPSFPSCIDSYVGQRGGESIWPTITPHRATHSLLHVRVMLHPSAIMQSTHICSLSQPSPARPVCCVRSLSAIRGKVVSNSHPMQLVHEGMTVLTPPRPFYEHIRSSSSSSLIESSRDSIRKFGYFRMQKAPAFDELSQNFALHSFLLSTKPHRTMEWVLFSF